MTLRLTSYFWDDDVLRSRSVSDIVVSGTVDVPAPPARLIADWDREITTRLVLEAGDVEALPLARARMRWPDYARCVQAARDWAGTLGLAEALAASEVALMASRGARYHHDGAQYGGSAFCNLFLGDDTHTDVHFAAIDRRIALMRGTIMLFDTGQPHALIRRDRAGFDAADFSHGRDDTQVFLTWELPIADSRVAQALRIAFDTDPSTTSTLDEAQVRPNTRPATLCPATGRWLPTD